MLKKIMILIFFVFVVTQGIGANKKEGTGSESITNKYRNNYLKTITERSADITRILDTLNASRMATNFVITEEQLQFVDMDDYQGQEDSKNVDLDIYKQLLFQLEKAAINKNGRTKKTPYTDFMNKFDPQNTKLKNISESDIEMQVSLFAYEKYIHEHKEGYVLNCSLFNVLPLKKVTFRGENAHFNFNQDNFNFDHYCYKKPDIEYLKVDFGDGAGYRKINIPNHGNFSINIDINYNSIGTKKIKSAVKFKKYGSVYYSNSEIEVKSLTIADPSYTLDLEINNPSSVKGKAYVYLSKHNNAIKNPIIVVEGFDIDENMDADELYDLLREQNLADELDQRGYDLIILNFDYAKDYIQKNAYLLINLIDKINTMKQSDNELVIIGASMGGLVARYALAYMELLCIDHQTRLYISFDSPHRGANIPIGVQYWFNFFARENAQAEELRNKLQSPAAKQMLIKHFKDHNVRENFVKSLENMGYPNYLRKIAISNGTGTGKGLNYNPHDKVIHYHYTHSPSLSYPTYIRGDVWAVSTEHEKVFDGRINVLGFTDEDEPEYDHAKWSLDNIPGGTKNTFFQMTQAPNKYGHIQALHDTHCFIPTISSLDINTEDPFLNIKEDEYIMQKTPFDSLYYPRVVESTNQEHVSISPEMKSWLLNELIPDRVVLDDEKEWGMGEIKAKKSIQLLPGFDVTNHTGLHLKINDQ